MSDKNMIYQQDAPESVKHWSGRDPADEPPEYDDEQDDDETETETEQ